MKFWSNIKYHTLMNLRWCVIQIFGWPCCVPGGQGQLRTAECGGLLFFAISLRQEAFGSLSSVWDRRSSALCHQFETGGPRLFAISLRQEVLGFLSSVWDRRSSALCHQFETGTCKRSKSVKTAICIDYRLSTMPFMFKFSVLSTYTTYLILWNRLLQ